MVAQFDLPIETGIIVETVQENTPAADAGIEVNDVILAIDGRPLDDHNPLIDVLFDHVPGESVTVTVWRQGDEFEVNITLAEREGSQ